MYSDRLIARDNVSINDRDHGIMLNYANYSDISGNVVEGGGEKCVFIYNSNRNRFERNRFEGCPIGVHFTGGSADNQFLENAFVANETQVKYVGSRWLDWATDGRGNYWSDHRRLRSRWRRHRGQRLPPERHDGPGALDPPARQAPNQQPCRATVLRWVQTQFPALYPGGVIDTAPLMSGAATSVTGTSG